MKRTRNRAPAIALLGGVLTIPVAVAAPGDGMGVGGAGMGFGGGFATNGAGFGANGAAPAAPGDNTSWGVTAGVTDSDNIERTLDNRINDAILQAGLQLGVADVRPILNTNIQANISYWDFLHGTFPSQFAGGANAGSVLTLLPNLLTWSVHDNYGQAAIDPTTVVTPGNMQSVNFFSTGPTLTLPLGSRANLLAVQGLYSRANYGESIQNNTEYQGAVSLQHRLSTMTGVSLTVSDAHTQYEDELFAPPYNVRELTLGFDATGLHTTLSTSVGYTQLQYLGATHGGVAARLGLTRQIGARSRLALNVGTEYANSATEFAEEQNTQGIQGAPVTTPTAPPPQSSGGLGAPGSGPFIPGGGVVIPTTPTGALTSTPGGVSQTVISGDPYKANYATVTWGLLGTRSELDFALDLRREVHQAEIDLNRDVGTASATYSRRLNPLVRVFATAYYSRGRFADADIDLNSWGAGVGLNWTLTQKLAVQASFNRTTGTGTGVERQYTEDRAYIGIAYSDGRHLR